MNRWKAEGRHALNEIDRVTGIQVADTGNRDEHGFELVEDYFPPTAKTVRTVTERRKSNRTILSSESMDIVLST